MTSALDEFRRWSATPDAPRFIYFTGNLVHSIDMAEGDAKGAVESIGERGLELALPSQRRVGPKESNCWDYVATRARKSPQERWDPNNLEAKGVPKGL